MKKVAALIIVLSVLLAAGAVCNADGYEKKAVAEIFSYEVSEEEIVVRNTVFTGAVEISGEFGSVVFDDCFFVGDVVNKGGEGAIVKLFNCEFAEGAKCIIDANIPNATMDTVIPKFMVFSEGAEIESGDVGAAVAMSYTPIIFNGEEYRVEDCEMYVDASGAFGQYQGQAEENPDGVAHNVCTWVENGEKQFIHLAAATGE